MPSIPKAKPIKYLKTTARSRIKKSKRANRFQGCWLSVKSLKLTLGWRELGYWRGAGKIEEHICLDVPACLGHAERLYGCTTRNV